MPTGACHRCADTTPESSELLTACDQRLEAQAEALHLCSVERERERERELKWIDYDPQVIVRRSDYTPITKVNRLRFRKVGLW